MQKAKNLKKRLQSLQKRAEIEQTSFIREWKEGSRHYIQLVLWIDESKKPPILVRKDFLKSDFNNFWEADLYAQEHGGYCTGVVSIRGIEYWCIFERE